MPPAPQTVIVSYRGGAESSRDPTKVLTYYSTITSQKGLEKAKISLRSQQKWKTSFGRSDRGTGCGHTRSPPKRAMPYSLTTSPVAADSIAASYTRIAW
jgi:hypothetical protein